MREKEREREREDRGTEEEEVCVSGIHFDAQTVAWVSEILL